MSTSGLQQYVMCLALGKEASSWNNRCSLGSRLPLLQSKWLLPAEGGHQEAHSWAGLPGSGVDLMKCPSHLSGAFAKPIHRGDQRHPEISSDPLALWGMEGCFPQWLHHFTFPGTSLPTLVIAHGWYTSHPMGMRCYLTVVSIHSPKDQCCWPSLLFNNVYLV
jgi:hypothetical protein